MSLRDLGEFWNPFVRFGQVLESLREFLTSLRKFRRVGRVLDKIGTARKSF